MNALISLLLVFSFTFAAAGILHASPVAGVVTEGSKVRSSTDSSNSIGSVTRGESIKIIELLPDSDWIKIETKNGLFGYVHKSVVVVSNEPIGYSIDPTGPLIKMPPKYPRGLKAGTKGFVDLELTVGKNGVVKGYKVLRSMPAGVFDEAAINSLKSFRYKPRLINGGYSDFVSIVRVDFGGNDD